MAKKSKLLTALDIQRGRDYEKERQKKMRRGADKVKRESTGRENKEERRDGAGELVAADTGAGRAGLSEVDVEAAAQDMLDELSSSGDEASGHSGPVAAITDTSFSSEEDSDQEDGAGAQLQRETSEAASEGLMDMDGDDQQEDEDDEDEDDEEEEEEDIPMSDIEELDPEDREDLIPHQRLTINNTAALLQAYKRIALPSSLPFSATQAVTSATQIEIEDVHDDLTREMAFYKQSLEAAVEGRARLRRDGVPFSRPTDYFAEMVKTDEHMGRIKARMIEQAANKKAAAEARRQRDLKKFGKQVQVARQQERDREKRDTLDRINLLKRKRKDAAAAGGGIGGNSANEEDMFDVALDNEAGNGAGARRRGEKGFKRINKDTKFGFGGKKRFAKSNDANSSGDMRGFSVKKMKGGAKRGKTPRPGKSKRARLA